ncbi:MAG TPA: tetratricopeptide repeat protein [Burkholderiales bacterium]|nr:tetratricopeptide repeat protein [Burkholderiales bacterium]
MRKFALALALLFPLGAAAGFDEGVQAYNSGDYAKAVAEFKPLAEQGHADAQFIMGRLYHEGYGVPRDQVEAAKWFRRAAEQANSSSQYYLGLMYEKGEGVQKDLVAAHMWLSLSKVNPPNRRDRYYTQEIIDKLEKKMSAEDVARAKKLAAEWKPVK